MAEQRLFISHASEDAAAVNRIVEYLEGRGVPCWIAGRDIPPRAIYAEAITSAIQACTACVVIVSEASNASAAIKRELELASHHDRPFIPVRIDRTEPGPGLDYYLRNTQWMDYDREQERALDRIVTHLKGPGPATAAPPLPQPPRKNVFPVLAIVGALVIVGGGAWYVAQHMRPSTDVAASAPEAPAPAPVQTVEVDGVWSMTMFCPNGLALQEPNATFQDASYQRRFEGAAFGETRLAMSSSDERTIQVSGQVAFDGGETYAVNAQGVTSDGATFTGSGAFGPNNGCPFSATRQAN